MPENIFLRCSLFIVRPLFMILISIGFNVHFSIFIIWKGDKNHSVCRSHIRKSMAMAVFRRGCVIFLLEYFIKISFVVITDGVHNLVYGFIRVFQHGFRMFQTDLLHIECSITGRYRYTEWRILWQIWDPSGRKRWERIPRACCSAGRNWNWIWEISGTVWHIKIGLQIGRFAVLRKKLWKRIISVRFLRTIIV